MFVGEPIDIEIARAVYVDGQPVKAVADRLGMSRQGIYKAKSRIDRNLKVLGLDHLAPTELRAMIQRLIANASGLTSSAA